MTATDPREDDVTALGSLLAGEVDGTVDELAAYILSSRWLSDHDRRIRAETLRDAAADVRAALADGIGGHTSTYSVRHWLRDRADRIEAGEDDD